MDGTSQLDQNPIALIRTLDRYSRRDYGSVFLYLPSPRRPADREAWLWLGYLQERRAARRRWIVPADHALIVLGASHAHLFAPPPVCFETYWLDQRSLGRIFAKL